MAEVPEKLKRKLSLPPSRLSGSERCRNCDTELHGPYCHYCGQPDRNLHRFFPTMLREALVEATDFDSRLLRTLIPLLFAPGKLAWDYMHGRRFRYTSPIRLYLFSNILFFLLASLMTSVSINDQMLASSAGSGHAPDPAGHVETQAAGAGSPVRNHDAETAPEKTPEGSTADAGRDTDEAQVSIDVAGGDIAIDAQGNTIDVSFFPAALNDWLNRELARAEEKGRAIEADPTLITDQIFDMLPATMFVLLPFFALTLKLFYPFSGRYYTEHLIFALYNHSFVFILATIVLVLNALGTLLWGDGPPDPGATTVQLADWSTNILLIAMCVYFWLAMKRFYGQGWLATTLKFAGVGLTYNLLLMLVTVLVAVLGFLVL